MPLAAPPAPPAPLTAPPANQPARRITLDLRDVGLLHFLTAYSVICGGGIIVDRAASASVTARLADAPCDEALRSVLRPSGLGVRWIGRYAIVAAAEKLAPPPPASNAVVYFVRESNVASVAQNVASSVPGASVTVDARANALVIAGTPQHHEQAQRLLRSLDTAVSQILFDVRVAEISAEALRALGVQWGPSNLQATIGALPGIQRGDMISLVSTLVSNGRGRMLAAAQVATVDGLQASVPLRDRLLLVPGPIAGAIATLTLNVVDVGVTLNLTPRVTEDGTVTVLLNPQISALAAVSPGAGGMPPAPLVGSRETTTAVRVRSGETVIIGGLADRRERQARVKVPVFDEVPALGRLFGTPSTPGETELIFLVTPVILGEVRETRPMAR